MTGRVVFPNPYGSPLPSESRVQALQQEFGFSDAYADFLLTQNGLDTSRWRDGEYETEVDPEVDRDWMTDSHLHPHDADQCEEENRSEHRFFGFLSPYFCEIGSNGGGDPYVEVLVGEFKGWIVALNHEIGCDDSIEEFFEAMEVADYDTMTEPERIAFLTGDMDGYEPVIWIRVTPSMREFTEHCLYVVDAFSQKIVAWHTQTRKDVSLVDIPLGMTVWARAHEGNPVP